MRVDTYHAQILNNYGDKVAKLYVYLHALGHKVGVVIIIALAMNLGKNYWLQSISRVKKRMVRHPSC